MRLTGLTQLLASLPQVERLRSASGHTRVFGLLSAAKPAVLSALVDRQLLVVTAHPNVAQTLRDDLAMWTGERVELFPALEALPYERVRVDRELVSQREAVARGLHSGDIPVVVAPVRALLQPVYLPGAESSIGRLEMGQRISLERLIQSWVDAGYVESSIVDEPGTFARRGGVIDIFPAGEQYPARIELFGDEVDSLRAFDPATQRSVRSLPAVTVPPIADLSARSRLQALDALMELDAADLTAEAQTRWLDDLGRLEAGAGLDDLPLLAPYLSPGSLLLDAISQSTSVVIDAAPEAWDVMDELWAQAVERQRDLEGAGELPRGMKPALVRPDQVRAGLRDRRVTELHPGTPGSDEDVELGAVFSPAPLYAGRLRTFLRDVQSTAGAVVVTSYQHERVADLLREEDVPVRRLDDLVERPQPGVSLLPISCSEGWRLQSRALSVLTDHELFGYAHTRPVVRRPRPAREAFFTQFAPGDFVVHLEHGIGRFEGVTRMRVEGADREYAIVQYAGKDRVYVPTDQLERLTRYVGMGEGTPQLSRLGGGEWQRARQRATQAAQDIAAELIDLYSKRQAQPGFGFSADTPWQRELESSFPYPETPDQLQAIEDVKTDMEADRPMDRLVCADVGYGKTEVAVRAAFKAVMDGKQVAVLVPTTILAQQHFETFSERLAAFPMRVEVLSRFRSPAEQRDILRRLGTGELDVIIGTHRLLQKDVHFKSLGLLIVDEEQRFGVKHKERLKTLRETVDVLTLTATPIPRTLHMTLSGIREVSVIETAPEGRLPVKTYLQPYDDRLVREAILRELDRDGQVYIVHNKVATIEAMAERVRRLVPEARVVVAHGQMEESQLERAMLTFAHHEADILVSSTIIENGLDIPNVNTIIMNNAHTLGLTQLYQLRGRVGRSANQAYAYLLYPRDAHLSHDAARRLEAVFEAQELGSGFGIAMKDLEIRGAGNLLGAEQSGHAAAIGFDLYTRMISDAVERLKGVPVREVPAVSLDLPLSTYLPTEYIGSEAERLTMYRRLAGVTTEEELRSLAEEIRDRFGPLPEPVDNLVASLSLKLLASAAGATSVVLNGEALAMRADPTALYDRVSLYRRYGTDARVSNNVLRIPRRVIGGEWLPEVRAILEDMARLRQSVSPAQPVGA